MTLVAGRILRRAGGLPPCCLSSWLSSELRCFSLDSRNVAAVLPPKPSAPSMSFHKRPLPKELIALSSPEGRKLFREALDEGGMESYFPLAEQFITQSEPSFCSISTLAMVMNALNFDIKRVWKGPWRWVSEEMLQCESQSVCGHSISRVMKNGLSFSEFESLARCHGVKIAAHPVCASGRNCPDHVIERFREYIRQVCSSTLGGRFVVVNFSRKALGQTGDGHYSPIAGYHARLDLALVLDVARFKYPPYWVRLQDLWDSMVVIDKATGRSRGYFVVSGWGEQALETDSLARETSSDVSSKTPESEEHHLCPSSIKSWVVDFDPNARRRPCMEAALPTSPVQEGEACIGQETDSCRDSSNGQLVSDHCHSHSHSHSHSHDHKRCST